MRNPEVELAVMEMPEEEAAPMLEVENPAFEKQEKKQEKNKEKKERKPRKSKKTEFVDTRPMEEQIQSAYDLMKQRIEAAKTRSELRAAEQPIKEIDAVLAKIDAALDKTTDEASGQATARLKIERKAAAKVKPEPAPEAVPQPVVEQIPAPVVEEAPVAEPEKPAKKAQTLDQIVRRSKAQHDLGIREIERNRDTEYEIADILQEEKDKKAYFAEQRGRKIKEEIEIDGDITTPVERVEPAVAEQLPGREALLEVFERASESEAFRSEIAEELPYTPVPVDQQIEPVIDAFAVGLDAPEVLYEHIKDEQSVEILNQNRETRQVAYDELIDMTKKARAQGNTASLKKLIEYTNQQQRAIQIIDERIAALGPRVGDKTEILENRFGKFMRRVFGLPRIWKKRE